MKVHDRLAVNFLLKKTCRVCCLFLSFLAGIFMQVVVSVA